MVGGGFQSETDVREDQLRKLGPNFYRGSPYFYLKGKMFSFKLFTNCHENFGTNTEVSSSPFGCFDAKHPTLFKKSKYILVNLSFTSAGSKFIN